MLDIAPLNEQVEIGNDKEGTAQFIEVRGISSRDILTLIQNFPDMQKFVSIGGINPQDILSLAPGAVGGIIAAGTGHVGELEHEQAADRLSIEAQLDLLEAIGRCTFRNGFGPFVMRISALVAVALSAKSGSCLLYTSRCV